MNKSLVAAIIALTTVCVGGTWMMSVGFKTAKKTSDDAFRFVNTELPPVLTAWDAKLIAPIAHPQLMKMNPTADTQKVFDQLKSKLGTFKKFNGWKTLGFNANLVLDGNKTVAANLEGDTEFEKGTAYVEVTLVRPEKKWQLAKFIVRDAAGMRSAGK